MIWFACKSCGKKHGRADNSAGAMIFCDCGASLTVPWESTIEEPEPSPAAPVVPTMPPPYDWVAGDAPPPPLLVPVPVGEERIPIVVPARCDLPPRGQAFPPHPGRAYPARLAPVRPRDRNFCFNHQSLPVEKTCDSCAERFCAGCLVTFQGKTLCGPCKNARVRELDVPPKVSGLALTSALAGAALSIAAFCLLPLGSLFEVLPLIIFVVLLQIGTLGMGALALYHTEKSSLLRGRSLALTGIIAAAVGILLTVAATLYSYMQWV
jgi:hypothetical protein